MQQTGVHLPKEYTDQTREHNVFTESIPQNDECLFQNNDHELVNVQKDTPKINDVPGRRNYLKHLNLVGNHLVMLSVRVCFACDHKSQNFIPTTPPVLSFPIQKHTLKIPLTYKIFDTS